MSTHVAVVGAYGSAGVAVAQRLTDSEDIEFLREPAAFVDDHRLAVGDRTLEPDYVVVATGSVPTVPDLPGTDWVADTMQARDDERVFVVGDANGKEPILHVAKEQGAVAAENILAHCDGDSPTDYANVHHHVVFSGLGVLPYTRVGHPAESAERGSTTSSPPARPRATASSGGKTSPRGWAGWSSTPTGRCWAGRGCTTTPMPWPRRCRSPSGWNWTSARSRTGRTTPQPPKSSTGWSARPPPNSGHKRL